MEPIGVFFAALGLASLCYAPAVAFRLMVVGSLFGSAAAILVGATNITPGHLLIVFASVAICTRRRELTESIAALKFPGPGFWLLCAIAYGMLTAYYVPRLFSGGTTIVPLGASEYDDTSIGGVPLGPVSSNLTQSMYMAANLACFCLSVGLCSSVTGFKAVTDAIILYAIGNIAFAIIDLVTFETGTQDILLFMRNARYTLHHEEEIWGLKRIVGSFTEASAFASASAGTLGFSGTLFICGRQRVAAGLLAASTLIFILFSTSSTGLASIPIIMALLFLTAVGKAIATPKHSTSFVVMCCFPVVLIAMGTLVYTSEYTRNFASDYIDLLIFNKSSSDSGVQRGYLNEYAISNFIDTWGIGVGLGTVRTSSFVVALIANLGIAGTVFYIVFLASTFQVLQDAPSDGGADFRLAARNGCLGLIIAGLFAAPNIDQGFIFYVMAGLAASRPKQYGIRFARQHRLRRDYQTSRLGLFGERSRDPKHLGPL